ncbi:MAG: hypothetical protein JRH20_17200 [Deltaproteobacteria bacterium]|nr:hypothetical protein [Deltaproteobacteria bacterium]
MIRRYLSLRLLPLALVLMFALPASAARPAQTRLRKVTQKYHVKSKHVIDFTSGQGVFAMLGVKVHRGPQNARFKGQFSVVRGTKLLLVVPQIKKPMVLTHELMRAKDFGKPEWYAKAYRGAQQNSPYEVLNGNIPLEGGRQGVLVRVKNNVPPASERLAGSNLVLQVVKPDKRSSRPLSTIFALQAHLVGGRAIR